MFVCLFIYLFIYLYLQWELLICSSKKKRVKKGSDVGFGIYSLNSFVVKAFIRQIIRESVVKAMLLVIEILFSNICA
jgi:hypothetical protein